MAKLVHIDNRGLYVGPYTKEELYSNGKLDLSKFSQMAGIANCTFAEALVVSALDGTLNTIDWRNRYDEFEWTHVFTTYNELLSMSNLLKNEDILFAISTQQENILLEFSRYYTCIYEHERRYLVQHKEQFFTPCFYPPIKHLDSDIDIYNRFDNYGLMGFCQAMFYYSITKQAFMAIEMSNLEPLTIEGLNNYVQKVNAILNRDTLISINKEKLKNTSEFYLSYITEILKREHQQDLLFQNEQVWKEALSIEHLALNSLYLHKDALPEPLFNELVTIEQNIIKLIGLKANITDIKPYLKVECQLGRRKQFLFANPNNPQKENIELKKQKQVELKEAIKQNRLTNHKITTSKDNPMNQLILEFVKKWRVDTTIAKKFSIPSLYRFLYDDCGLDFESDEKIWSTFFRKLLK